MKPALTRLARIGATSAVAAVALVAAVATPALAYPGIPAASTGSCSPSSQTVGYPSAYAGVTCTFTFLDSSGAPVVGKPFGATATAGATKGPTSAVTDAAGKGTVAFTLPNCSTIGTTAITVTGTGGDAGAASSTQATFTATCNKQDVDVTSANCVAGGIAPDLQDGNGPGTKWACTFQASVTGRKLAVAYAIDSSDDFSFIKTSDAKSDKTTGVFTAEVWAYGAQDFSITGIVQNTQFVNGGSKTFG